MKPARDPGDLAEKLDTLAGPAAEPGNAALSRSAGVLRWTGPVFGLLSVILLPWAGCVATSLPSRHVCHDTSWAGFDVMPLVALAGTAYLALRRSRYLSAAVLLVADA